MNSPLKLARWMIAQGVHHQTWLVGSLALALNFASTQPVAAEGSIDLIENGGDRPFLEFRTDDTSGVQRQTVIKVYAEAGETLNLGSSATGLGQGNINFRRPDGTPDSCGPGVGLIANLTEEQAGPGAGYAPCQVPVDQTGIWEIDFVSPNPNSDADPASRGVNQEWTQLDNVGYVSAWDVTVQNANGAEVLGRAYANYMALNLGSNNRSLNSVAYILTEIGFLYRINLNGLDPFGFIFFANNKGFRDGGGNPLFRSVELDEANFHNPSTPDTADDVTFKLFFNPPNTDLPLTDQPSPSGTTWLGNVPPPIPFAADLAFETQAAPPNQNDSPLEGEFVFNTNAADINYLVTIDLDDNPTFGSAGDVVLTGQTQAGENRIDWDLLDTKGNPIAAGSTLRARVSLIVGDVHLPILDPENSNGLIIERLDNNTPQSSTVFYDDSNLAPTGGPPNPIRALGGIESTPGGAHGFGNGSQRGFGDEKGIDTWTSLADQVDIEFEIPTQQVDLSIEKTDTADPINAGQPITYTLTVTNNLPPASELYVPVQGAVVTDTVPAEIGGVEWACEITSGTGSCSVASGTGNEIDLALDLDVGAIATITVNGTVAPTALGTVTNTATVEPPLNVEEANPNNNTDTEDTTVNPNPVQPAGIKSVRLFQDADGSGSLTTGDTVEYTVTYINTDPLVDVTNFQATDSLDSNSLTFVNNSYSFTVAGTGTTVAANPNYNGTTDLNLNTPGVLARGGGQVTIKYQALVTAAEGAEINNQAIATSTGGTVEQSLTDAFQGAEDFPQLADDGIEQGNLPGTGDDEPTRLVVGAPPSPPVGTRLSLVKRITNVIKDGVPIEGTNFGSFVDDPNDQEDNALQESGFSPLGIVNLGSESALESDDIVEYTIYFFSEGPEPANGIRFCDSIPEGTEFITDGFNQGRGVLLSQNGNETAQTNLQDQDQGRFFERLEPLDSLEPAPPCPDSNNNNGAVFVNLGDIPEQNFGFVRFRVRIR
ncbi:MAG: isopeptide-forming domain-containing fimbrial protein [Coleofasciculaceae cyanobacterium]